MSLSGIAAKKYLVDALYHHTHSTFLLARSLPIFHRHSAVAAFVPNQGAERAATTLNAERREVFGAAAAAVGMAFAPLAANAIRDYENVGYLGGGQVVDVNNANVRSYLKMQGLYPTVAGKIASNGPYKSVSDLYNIPGLSGTEKDLIKKYESRFTAKEPAADYVIDRINNGLYVSIIEQSCPVLLRLIVGLSYIASLLLWCSYR